MLSTIYDDEAEHHVAGAAAFSSTAARLAADRLDGAHLHDPRVWWVITASLEVPDTAPRRAAPPCDAEPEWWREDAVADRAGVDRLVLRDWCRFAPCAIDATGRLAERVWEAAARRTRLQALLDELEVLGVGVEVTV